MLDLLDAEGKAEWLEHPEWGRSVDVVALKIGPLDGAKLFHQPINTHAFDNFEPAVGDDAFVIGFPMRMDGGSGFPIWKRASIASEPDIDLDGLPKLLIDTATRKGMSGSPVIAMRRGIIKPRGSIEFKDTIIGQGEEFLGVTPGASATMKWACNWGLFGRRRLSKRLSLRVSPGKRPSIKGDVLT